MKKRYSLIIFCIIILILIGIVIKAEVIEDSSQSIGYGKSIIAGNDLEVSEDGKITVLESGATIRISDSEKTEGESNVIKLENIAGSCPTIEGSAESCYIKLDKNNPSQINECNLMFTKKTSLNLNGETYFLEPGTHISYKEGILTIAGEQGNKIGIGKDINGNPLNEITISNVDLSKGLRKQFIVGYDETGNTILKGNDLNIVSKNGEKVMISGLQGQAEIKLNSKGEIKKIKNARVNYQNGRFIEAENEAEIYYSNADKLCPSYSSSIVGCITNAELLSKGGVKVGYDSKIKGYFAIKTYQGQEISATKIGTEIYKGEVYDKMYFKGKKGYIENGGNPIRLDSEGNFRTNIRLVDKLEDNPSYPMIIYSKGDTGWRISKSGEKDLLDIGYLESQIIGGRLKLTQLQLEEIPFQQEAVASPETETPSNEPQTTSEEDGSQTNLNNEDQEKEKDPCSYYKNIEDRKKCYEDLDHAVNWHEEPKQG